MIELFTESSQYFDGSMSAIYAEAIMDVDELLLESGATSDNIFVRIITKIKEFIKNIINAFRKFLKDFKNQTSRYIQSIKLKQQLKEVRQIISQNPNAYVVYSDIWSYENHLNQYIIEMKRVQDRIKSMTIADFIDPNIVNKEINNQQKLRENYTKILDDDIRREVRIYAKKLLEYLEKEVNSGSRLDRYFDSYMDELDDLYDYFDDLSSKLEAYSKETGYRIVKNINPNSFATSIQKLKDELFNSAKWARSNKQLFGMYMIRSGVGLYSLVKTAAVFAKPTKRFIKNTITNVKKGIKDQMAIDESDPNSPSIKEGMSDFLDTNKKNWNEYNNEVKERNEKSQPPYVQAFLGNLAFAHLNKKIDNMKSSSSYINDNYMKI